MNAFFKQIDTNVYNDFIDTGIDANPGSFGQTILVIGSDHVDTGDKTISEICMIRCGYDGNNVRLTKIARESNEWVTTEIECSCNESGHLMLKGCRRYLIISNKLIV